VTLLVMILATAFVLLYDLLGIMHISQSSAEDIQSTVAAEMTIVSETIP